MAKKSTQSDVKDQVHLDPEAGKKAEDALAQGENESRKYDLNEFNDIYDMIKSHEDENEIKGFIEAWIIENRDKHGLGEYHIVFLISDKSIQRFVSNGIYQTLNRLNKNERDILLVLDSPGGKLEPAYLISKACKKWSKNCFSVAVPRMEKSAATLLSLGADRIHMGQMSELGPIDLQIGDLPVLGLTNSLNVISDLVSKCPGSTEMWANYLTKNLNLMHLGYFDRVNTSASQYGERLLAGKKLANGQTAESITKHLVHHYKDHAFVIDYDECLNLFGDEMIKYETNEYKFSVEVMAMLDNVRFMLDYVGKKKELHVIGDIKQGMMFLDKKDNV